jgi:hypothetical protein
VLRRSCLAFSLVALGLAGGLAPGARAAVPGINVDVSQVAGADATGARIARVFVAYPSAPGAYDDVVAGFTSAGIKPILVVTGRGAPPADAADYGREVGALAARYGGRLTGIEIWNEEDEASWWGTAGGDPAAYARLLRAAYAAVGGRVRVALGGMTGNDYAFLDAVYQALGGSSRGAFDAVAVHTDTACSLVGPDSFYRDSTAGGRIGRYSFLGVREVHATMAAHGDADKPIWMTEIGWNTSSRVCDSGIFAGQKAGGVSETTQARYLTMAYRCLADYDYVEYALWFNLRDPAGNGDSPLYRYGLLDHAGHAKPAYDAFRDAVRGRATRSDAPCGDFSPPTIAVERPDDGARFADRLAITASAADGDGVGRITLEADGRRIRSFTTGTAHAAGFPKRLSTTIGGRPFTWYGASKLALGRHVIKVIAIDANGNLATRTFAVVKVLRSQLGALTTRFATFALTGRGARRTLRARVVGATADVPFRAADKVRIVFRRARRGRWVVAHRYAYSAKAPIAIRVALAPGRWRVSGTFARRPPFRASRSRTIALTVR